jgi:hypothetical protein
VAAIIVEGYGFTGEYRRSGAQLLRSSATPAGPASPEAP